jgi:hypothetical protein
MKRRQTLLVCIVLAAFSVTASAQHLPDLEFKAVVERPAYPKNSPRIMFDEAHNNFHTSTGRYKPFADLLMADGYRLVINRQPFTKKVLDSFKLLIIANALADDVDEPDAEKPAFTDEECLVIKEWVRGGGSLLLIADPGPFGKSAANLAKQFGVEMESQTIEDTSNSAEQYRSSLIVYSRENNGLVDHPITAGRDTAEKIGRVIVFGGQSLNGPKESVYFLKLADSARNLTHGANGETVQASRGVAQGLALKVGDGRVVVLAEADMLTALLGEPPEKEPIGMNYPDVDNKQLTLNIMHWLSGLLK